ncbi:MAG: NAD-dependent succinate-semialdehyde dehydrogenase [Bacteroidota bacterium]
MSEFKLLIGGRWVDAAKGETFVVTNPANGETVAEVAKGSVADAQLALETAAKTFPQWARLTPKARATYLHKAANRVRERLPEIARLLTLEQGKPYRDAQKEVEEGASVLDYFAEEGVRVRGEIIASETASARQLVIKQPLGVAVGITPWNYPVSLLAWKLAAALAAGCTFVAKPASETPLAATEYVRCVQEAGLPDGVVNLVVGPGSTVGTALVASPLSAKVAFTGSTEVGRQLMAQAAVWVKKVSLELGGHSPFIVCEDADFELAAKHGPYRAFRNMGQVCNSVNRILVHESLFERYVERAVEEAKKLTIGDGMAEPPVDLGPMLNQKGIDRTRAHIDDAVAKGARLLCGGRKPEGSQYEKGFFFEPSILVDVRPDMKVMQEETFGPLVAIVPFKTLDEAISIANGVQYGLVSYAYTTSLKTAARLAEELEAGTVCINNIAGSTVNGPYPGWKQSGSGVELSHHGINEYLHLKHVRIDLG